MIKKIKNKRGELTLTTLIPILIAIASFAVLMFLWWRVNFAGGGSQQVCHTSIVLFALTKGLLGKPNCNTQFVCISGGDACTDINPTQTIKVDSSNKNEVFKAIADNMKDCWSTYGEGNLDFVQINRFAVANSGCAICSIMKFDDKVQQQASGMTYQDFFNYAANNKIEGTQQTYLSYLYGVNDEDSFLKTYPIASSFMSKTILPKDEYAVLTGEVRKDWLAFWVQGGVIHPMLVDSNDISSLKCDVFITKIS
ncbi:MAG TPA: hypothetical protein VMC80_02440 [Patescibacteria group bacterium]|nr:hypothetical protein [Patescibacteria group bacterium]